MKLDALDISLLDHAGLPQATLAELLDWKIGANNAEKARQYIRQYLRYKESIDVEERQIGEMEETVIKADGTITTQRMLLLSEEDSKSPKRIMELMGYDILQWELISCKTRRNYWDISMKLDQGEDSTGKRLPQVPIKKTNHAYACTITIKPIQQILTTQMIKEVFDALSAPNLCIYRGIVNANKLMEFPIMDLHLGKLSWDDETGENWDLKIAEKIFRWVITDALERIKSYNLKIEKIVFPIGQDFLHFDTPGNTTTGGTVMDSDTRWQKMFAKGVELLVWAIENLRSVAPVECMYVAGNHDKMLSYALVYTLNAYFRNTPDVLVDVSPTSRKYVRYGNTLIGFSHGNEEGKRIEKLMQVEASQDWGETKFREWHLGHLHHEEVKEEGGVIIRKLSSITSTDSWHTERGYKGAIRKAQIFIWDKETGKDLTIDIYIPEIPDE
jgi:hypothetical protein